VYLMYSVVLMMALSGSGEVPALGRGGCCGCNGGYGYSCGGGWGGGCCGGGHFRRWGGGCRGWGGGCCGYSNGCGCCGYNAGCGCCGYNAGCGCGGYNYGCGCNGYYGGGMYYGGHPADGQPAGTERVRPPKRDTKKGDGGDESALPAPARIIVSIPADAKLMVDDFRTTSTSGRRVFTTPALERGQIYAYTLQAEVMRDGATETLSKEVTVRAGEEAQVSFEFTSAGLAQK
jgi:uncharacterized protein (TIGR03000 family)